MSSASAGKEKFLVIQPAKRAKKVMSTAFLLALLGITLINSIVHRVTVNLDILSQKHLICLASML